MKTANKTAKTAQTSKAQIPASTAAKVVTEIKVPEVIKEEKPKETVPPVAAEKPNFPFNQPSSNMTMEEATERIGKKFDAVQKLESLRETKRNISSFRVGDDGIRTEIRIKDIQGRDFITTNADLLKAVIDTCIKVVDNKISLVEKEILFD